MGVCGQYISVYLLNSARDCVSFRGGGVWVALLGKVKGSYFRGCFVIVLCLNSFIHTWTLFDGEF